MTGPLQRHLGLSYSILLLYISLSQLFFLIFGFLFHKKSYRVLFIVSYILTVDLLLFLSTYEINIKFVHTCASIILKCHKKNQQHCVLGGRILQTLQIQIFVLIDFIIFMIFFVSVVSRIMFLYGKIQY